MAFKSRFLAQLDHSIDAGRPRLSCPRLWCAPSILPLRCGMIFPCRTPPLVIGCAGASKDGHMTQTLRIDPEVAVAKARALLDTGWEVCISRTRRASDIAQRHSTAFARLAQ
jgi:hypothetical protein